MGKPVGAMRPKVIYQVHTFTDKAHFSQYVPVVYNESFLVNFSINVTWMDSPMLKDILTPGHNPK